MDCGVQWHFLYDHRLDQSEVVPGPHVPCGILGWDRFILTENTRRTERVNYVLNRFGFFW